MSVQLPGALEAAKARQLLNAEHTRRQLMEQENDRRRRQVKATQARVTQDRQRVLAPFKDKIKMATLQSVSSKERFGVVYTLNDGQLILAPARAIVTYLESNPGSTYTPGILWVNVLGTNLAEAPAPPLKRCDSVSCTSLVLCDQCEWTTRDFLAPFVEDPDHVNCRMLITELEDILSTAESPQTRSYGLMPRLARAFLDKALENF